MDFIPMPADPERQRALPEDPGTCSHCGACCGPGSGTDSSNLACGAYCQGLERELMRGTTPWQQCWQFRRD